MLVAVAVAGVAVVVDVTVSVSVVAVVTFTVVVGRWMALVFGMIDGDVVGVVVVGLRVVVVVVRGPEAVDVDGGGAVSVLDLGSVTVAVGRLRF